MSDTSRLVARARQLGREYFEIYSCAPATLLAVAKTLNMPVSDEVFNTMLGLSRYSGGCGSLCGAIAAVGLRFGRNRTPLGENPKFIRFLQVVKRVRDQFVTEYGGYLCYDLQTKLFGRSYNTLDHIEELEAFMQRRPVEECQKITENAAGWTIEAILETEASSG
jgi:hypothetical protein